MTMSVMRALASTYRSNLLYLGRHGTLESSRYGVVSRAQGIRFHQQLAAARPATPSFFFSRNFAALAKDKESSAPPPPTPPEDTKFPFLPKWARWLFGSVLATVLPFWSTQLQTLLQIEDKVEEVVEVVEGVVEAVDKVATIAEQVSSEIADQLPDGKLRDALEAVEHVAEEVVDKTKVAEDIFDKVEELKEEVETLFEPVADNKGGLST